MINQILALLLWLGLSYKFWPLWWLLIGGLPLVFVNFAPEAWLVLLLAAGVSMLVKAGVFWTIGFLAVSLAAILHNILWKQPMRIMRWYYLVLSIIPVIALIYKSTVLWYLLMMAAITVLLAPVWGKHEKGSISHALFGVAMVIIYALLFYSFPWLFASQLWVIGALIAGWIAGMLIEKPGPDWFYIAVAVGLVALVIKPISILFYIIGIPVAALGAVSFKFFIIGGVQYVSRRIAKGSQKLEA